jgi:hypothetical protein
VKGRRLRSTGEQSLPPVVSQAPPNSALPCCLWVGQSLPSSCIELSAGQLPPPVLNPAASTNNAAPAAAPTHLVLLDCQGEEVDLLEALDLALQHSRHSRRGSKGGQRVGVADAEWQVLSRKEAMWENSRGRKSRQRGASTGTAAAVLMPLCAARAAACAQQHSCHCCNTQRHKPG